MNVLSKILTTAFKSALLASILFTLGISAMDSVVDLFIIPQFFMIAIVSFIMSIVGIIVTILPFYYLSKNQSLEENFKLYFPIYAIIYFIICLIFAYLIVGFTIGSLLLGIVYVTAMFAWVWFFKPEKRAEVSLEDPSLRGA